MAHQCLQCGHLFPEGSSAILQGCPQCKGTRFFYTRSALPEGERQAMAAKAQKDLRDVVADILKAAPASDELKGKVAQGLSNLRPSDLRDLMKAAAIQPRADGAAPPATVVVEAEVAQRRAEVVAQVEEQRKVSDHPDTVNIRKVGQYDIDIAALLDHSPIVVHKDGSYHIHLASLFDQHGRN